MNTKEKILTILLENPEKSISGQELANSLNLSRNSIWKGIKELQKEGYTITASPHQGYTLVTENNILSKESLKLFLHDPSIKENILIFKTLDSTNDFAKKLALAPFKDKTLVVANEQTNGKGRQGKSFFSPPDTGIYFSILLRPTINISHSYLITIAAAVAICQTLEKNCLLTPKIKWVNDIFWQGKKIAGILTEASSDFESGTIKSLVLGIGLNFKTKDFPKDLEDIAGSITNLNDSHLERNQLIAEIVNTFLVILEDLENPKHLEEYRRLSLVIGREIETTLNKKTIRARVLNIDDQGGLVIQTSDQKTHVLRAGEISIKGDFNNEKK